MPPGADGFEPLAAFLSEIDALDAQGDEAIREMAATQLIDAAAKNSRGVPSVAGKTAEAKPAVGGEREMILKRPSGGR